MFSLICAWINRWVNNRKAGDLRHHRGHYDVIAMYNRISLGPLNTTFLTTGVMLNATLWTPHDPANTRRYNNAIITSDCRFYAITVFYDIVYRFVSSPSLSELKHFLCSLHGERVWLWQAALYTIHIYPSVCLSVSHTSWDNISQCFHSDLMKFTKKTTFTLWDGRVCSLWPYWAHFAPPPFLVIKIYFKLVVSDHYLENWSPNPLHTRCIHWLRQFRNNSNFDPFGSRKMAETGVLTIIWNIVHSTHFTRGVLYTDWVSLQKWFDFFTINIMRSFHIASCTRS